MAVEKNNSVKIFVTAFIVVVLALAFVVSIAEQTNSVTSQTKVSNETLNLATFGGRMVNFTIISTNTTNLANPNTAVWKQENDACNIVPTFVGNATGRAGGVAGILTADTDYVVSSDGLFYVKNTAKTVGFGNVTLVDYGYCANNYVDSSWARTVLGTNVGLYALALLAVVVYLVYTLLGKKEDDD